MVDLLVPLYRLPPSPSAQSDTVIRRAMPYEREEVEHFARSHFNGRWASEAGVSMSAHPMSCFIAIKNGALVGFACYNSTFLGFCGPFGVEKSARGNKIGEILLHSCLRAMKESGFAYAIIGDVEEALGFYQKCVNATIIENSKPGAYHYDLLPK